MPDFFIILPEDECVVILHFLDCICKFFFFFIFYIYLRGRDSNSDGKREQERGGEGKAGSPLSREPAVGLDLRILTP